jgi:plasmid stabilization system protein ParE
LGRRFYDEITSVFRRVIEHPLRYKQFDPPARRLFANRFPYAVIYVVRPDAILVRLFARSDSLHARPDSGCVRLPRVLRLSA